MHTPSLRIARQLLLLTLFAVFAAAIYFVVGVVGLEHTPPGVLLVLATAPFPINPQLVAVALGYRNARLIADEVLPRIPVGTQEYKYYKWNVAEGFTIPNTRVGRTSKPNEVEFSATETPSKCWDYALDDPIPQADIANAPAGIDPRGRAVEGLTDLIMLDREVRVANLIFSLASYPTSNRETLSGNDQFSDFVNSDPVGALTDALDVPLVRPNVMVIGQPAWTKLSQHPAIVSAVNRNSGDKGIAPRQAVAELFELDEILVGQARVNTAKKGQAASLARTWGKHIALLCIDKLSDPTRSQSRVTFGFTAQWGDKIAGSQPSGNIGMRGGELVRVGESVDEEICGADLGYFIQNAVA